MLGGQRPPQTGAMPCVRGAPQLRPRGRMSGAWGRCAFDPGRGVEHMGSPANTLVPTEAHPANLYAAKQPWCECRVTLDPGFLLTRALDIAPGAPAGVHFPQVEYIRGAGRGN